MVSLLTWAFVALLLRSGWPVELTQPSVPLRSQTKPSYLQDGSVSGLADASHMSLSTLLRVERRL
jgi:hypothetical protein